MRARLFQASIVVFAAMPLFMASFAACGDDTGSEAFGGGDAASTATSTGFASSGTPVSATSTTTTSQSSGGDGGAGGSGGDGGASSSDGGAGGGEGGAGGGEGGAGGNVTATGVGGGVTGVACDNGCVPFPEGAGGAGGGDDDCDDDGALNDSDCQPCNFDVFPGQTEFFGVGFATFEDEALVSFDYDCDGVASFEYSYSPTGCDSLAPNVDTCEGAPIYSGGDNPSCGVQHFVQDCSLQAFLLEANCINEGPGSTMAVRCN